MVIGGHNKDIVDWGLPRDRLPPASYKPAPTLPKHRSPLNSTHTVPSTVPNTPPGHTCQELDASSVTSSQRAYTAGAMATYNVSQTHIGALTVMVIQANIQDTIKLEFQESRLKKKKNPARSRQYLEYTQTINIFI